MRKLILTITLCCSFASLQAGHIFGGEIWYEYIGDSTGTPYHYNIFLRLYSDQASIGNSRSLSITSSCFATQSLTLNLGIPNGYIQDSLGGYYLPAMRSCNDDSVPEFSYDLYVHHFQQAVILNGTCSDYLFKFTECCRQVNLDNIVNPSSIPVNLEAKLNNTLGPNRSPKFRSAPLSKFCSLNSYNVSHRAVDWYNGDSLHHKLAAINKYSAGASYSPGYTQLQPIQSLSGVTLDPQFGTLNFTPSQAQTVVVRIDVEEYRYDTTFGLWLNNGSSSRDIVYFVGNCSSNLTWGFDKDSLQIDTSIVAECGDSSIIISPNSPIDITTLALDGTDFFLQDDQGNPIPIKRAYPLNFGFNKFSSKFILDLFHPIQSNGLYKLSSRLGSDGNTLYNICGFQLPKHDTVKFIVSNCNTTVGLEEAENLQLQLYPSPARDFLNVVIPSTAVEQKPMLHICDIHGKTLQSNNITEGTQKISITDLPQGMYIVILQTDNRSMTIQKFIKK